MTGSSLDGRLYVLPKDRVPAVIYNMQERDQAWQFNLIVAAMDTTVLPCP